LIISAAVVWVSRNLPAPDTPKPSGWGPFACTCSRHEEVSPCSVHTAVLGNFCRQTCQQDAATHRPDTLHKAAPPEGILLDVPHHRHAGGRAGARAAAAAAAARAPRRRAQRGRAGGRCVGGARGGRWPRRRPCERVSGGPAAQPRSRLHAQRQRQPRGRRGERQVQPVVADLGHRGACAMTSRVGLAYPAPAVCALNGHSSRRALVPARRTSSGGACLPRGRCRGGRPMAGRGTQGAASLRIFLLAASHTVRLYRVVIATRTEAGYPVTL